MKETLAYLAGAIDADGYFGVKRWLVKGKTGAFPRFVCRVGLAEITPQIPRLLAKVFGGAVHLRNRQRQHWQDMWTWSIDSRLAAEAARQLLPYLRIKRRQAMLLLRLQREIDIGMLATVAVGRHGRQLSPRSLRKRDSLWKAMKRLNG